MDNKERDADRCPISAKGSSRTSIVAIAETALFVEMALFVLLFGMFVERRLLSLVSKSWRFHKRSAGES